MRYLLPALVLALVVAPARAADAKPNTLTPKEIADGWLLLFDGETTFGWKIKGEAKIENGKLVLGGGKETTATAAAFGSFSAHLSYRLAPGKAADLRIGYDRPYPLQASPTPSELDFNGVVGKAPVQLHVPADSRLMVSDFRIQPSRLDPIFNGKDLTGWKEIKTNRTKSVFTVNDGELRIKSGPGDLQTENLWDDFILQLDCRTNGKHLNSGVFFRCIPDQYTRGYEAQIHNNFTINPPKEYTVDEYDPETHKLVGKKKMRSAARDYGTGAIYNRVPARKQMAKDNEWFTMTVAAAGRHFAVWVNGVQVTDWTDNRPMNVNPRNGCRLEKGAISLQGHDPTTDLSFRNIRIAPLAK